MSEIGSEFWSVPTGEKENSVFSPETQWFISGRSALRSIISELQGCHTVSIPSWCCESIVKPFTDAGMEVCFYPVIFDYGDIQKPGLNSDVLFIMDFFGFGSPVYDLSGYNGIVIRDVTHSIFSGNYSDADYYFGSLRKWCGVWTGGFAWTKDHHRLITEQDNDFGYVALRKEAMRLKQSYIDNGADNIGSVKEKYLKDFISAETVLDKINILPAAERDVCISRQLDIDFIRSRHRENAELLFKAFHNWLIFKEIRPADCPMFVPVLVPDGKRDALRQYLIQNRIYCPVHWPISEYHRLTSIEQYIYDNELSLICDQRYTKEDMHRLINTINCFFAETSRC